MVYSAKYARLSDRASRAAREWCRVTNDKIRAATRKAQPTETASWAKFGCGWFAVRNGGGLYRVVHLSHREARDLGPRFEEAA